MKDILVIGTEPQCPRCKLLSNIMESMNDEFDWNANVSHTAYDAEEAQEIAEKLGLRANTAKEVAKLVGMPMDKDLVNQLCSPCEVKPDSEWAALNDCSWRQELDDYLKPYQERARVVGILMTPVLVVDGEVIWEGSVPNREQLLGLLGVELR